VLPAGTTIGGYRVIRTIGAGGMGTVYEAAQVSLQRVVALKVLSQEPARDDPTFLERFERECRAQAELDHPHIVTVFDNGDEPGPWLAMRLVRGRNLAEVFASERLDPEAALGLLAPIADALEAAHAIGLIHRDIKLENILVAEDGTPFLADFGLTTRLGDQSLTESGKFVGTPMYLAPERIKDELALPASDVYSLAVVLFRCLCGRFPFEQREQSPLFYAHLNALPPAPTAIDGSLPPQLDGVLARGLAKDPADRYSRPSELIADARACFEGRALPSVPLASPGRRTWARAPRWQARLLAGAAALLFAVGLGAGALADGSPRQEERRIRAGPLEVAAPDGWVRERGVLTRFPNLILANSVTLVPGEGNGREAVIVGISLARGASLLPFSLRSYWDEHQGHPIELNDLQALRYEGLGPQPKVEPWTVIVSPTSLGVATIACRADSRRADLHRTCLQLAASLELLEGGGYPLGPSPRLAALLREQMGSLNREVVRLGNRMVQTSRRGTQAVAAMEVADAYRRRARTLAAISVTPQSAAHLAGVVGGLRFVRDAYEELAEVFRSGNRQAFRRGISEISLTETILFNRLTYLNNIGYRVAPPYWEESP
jgi:hypothetical protein